MMKVGVENEGERRITKKGWRKSEERWKGGKLTVWMKSGCTSRNKVIVCVGDARRMRRFRIRGREGSEME